MTDAPSADRSQPAAAPNQGQRVHHGPDPHDNLGLATGDRVELLFTNDPHTRLRPGARGTVTGIGQIPGDPPEAQVHVAWDDVSTLAMLPTAGAARQAHRP
jgi:hypothetical protein